MIQYPDGLVPTAVEKLTLPSGRVVSLPKATPVFQRWQGPVSVDTYGNKPLINLDGEVVYAELAILRLFQAEGWQGVWVDTYRRKMRTGITEYVSLPAEQEKLLQQMYQAAQTRTGCFDVFCWQHDVVLFAESKRKRRDQIRQTQLKWLEGAMTLGLSPGSFLLVEWTLV
jgi:hypothetical protein